MSIITRSSFNSDLLPIVKNWYGVSYKDLPTFYDKVFTVEQADNRAYQMDAVISGMSTLQQKGEGSSLTLDSSRQMYTPKYTHISYALGFVITKEMFSDSIAMKNAKKLLSLEIQVN